MKYGVEIKALDAAAAYTPRVKKQQDTLLLPITLPMLTDFQNSFTNRLSSKRVMKWSLKNIPHLIRVATLPCEMYMSGN